MSSLDVHVTDGVVDGFHGILSLLVEECLGWVFLESLLFDPGKILSATSGQWHDDEIEIWGLGVVWIIGGNLLDELSNSIIRSNTSHSNNSIISVFGLSVDGKDSWGEVLGDLNIGDHGLGEEDSYGILSSTLSIRSELESGNTCWSGGPHVSELGLELSSSLSHLGFVFSNRLSLLLLSLFFGSESGFVGSFLSLLEGIFLSLNGGVVLFDVFSFLFREFSLVCGLFLFFLSDCCFSLLIGSLSGFVG